MLCLNVIDMSLTQYIFIYIYMCVCVDCTVCMFPHFSAWEAAKTEGSSKPALVSVAQKENDPGLSGYVRA